MSTRCVRIKLTNGSSDRVKEWANELNRRSDEVLAALRSEGVSLEAASTARQSTASIDAYHEAFKKACWESRRKLESLIDFPDLTDAPHPPGARATKPPPHPRTAANL